VMSGIDASPYQKLPLIVGSDAPAHVAELMEILAAEPELATRFVAAVRVGERRWNIRLSDNIEVRLPEKEPASAWKRLAELQSAQQLLDRNVKVIDLRVDGRLFIKLAPEDMPGKPVNAKET
jgi:cell division protein FtsQ